MFIRIILSLLLLLGVAGTASATSCSPFTQRYFILCDTSGCRAAFSVNEVSGFEACDRRPEVEAMDPQVGDFVSKIVTEMRAPDANGLYQLTMSAPYWHEPGQTKYERLMVQLEHTVPRDESGARCKVNVLSAAEIAEKLKKSESDGVLVHVSKDATVQDVDARRRAFETQELLEKMQSILLSMTYWASSVLVLLALVQSVFLYFQRTYRPVPGKRWVALMLPVAIQLAVGGIGVGVAMSMHNFWPGSFLVPAVVLVLLCEGWTSFRVSRNPI